MNARPSAAPRLVDVLDGCRALAEEAFGSRLRSLYLIGSLARGDFAAGVSDIGMALFLAAPLAAHDAEQIAAVAAYCAAAHPVYGRRLSLFWATAESFADVDAVQVPGRFPALDRLDLVEHGQLFAGEDLRAGLTPPTRAAILENSREDLLRFVRDPNRYGFLTGGATLGFHDRQALTRLCLFPARFLYTMRSGTIASNDVAAAAYCDAQDGVCKAITALALALRHDPARTLTTEERTLLTAELPGYYQRFLREFLVLWDAPMPAPEATLPLLLAALAEARQPLGEQRS